jgi:hypothetical protein
VSTGDEPERRLAEALRARATGAGRPGPLMPLMPSAAAAGRRPASAGPSIVTILLIALLVGAVLGSTLALISLLLPGLVPALG